MHHIMNAACYYIILIDLFIRPIVCMIAVAYTHAIPVYVESA